MRKTTRPQQPPSRNARFRSREGWGTRTSRCSEPGMGRQPVGWVKPQATTHRIAVAALTRDDQNVNPSH